jgi:hypothetical protein
MPKRIRPVSSKRDPTLKFRYLDDRPTSGPSVNWASCQTNFKGAFRNDVFVDVRRGGLYLTNSDLGLVGLGLAGAASLALAWVGPAQAFYTFGIRGLVASSASIGKGVLSALAAGALGGAIPPASAKFTDFNKPCSENRGAAV